MDIYKLAVIKHTTERLNLKTNIEIDVSTDCKDLNVTQVFEKEDTARKLNIRFTPYEMNIGNVKLIGKEIELLKDFLNDKL